MRLVRRVGLFAFGLSASALAVAATAWACIAGPTLDAAPRTVRAGSEVTLQGVSYNRNPVEVRLDSLNGPVLATLQPEGGTGTSSNYSIKGPVPIPADTKPGDHVLVATQPDPTKGGLSQVPTRALITVTGDGGVPVLGASPEPVTAERPEGLVEGESVSTGAKVLAGLGAAGGALFLAGVAAMIAGRRPVPAREAVRVGD